MKIQKIFNANTIRLFYLLPNFSFKINHYYSTEQNENKPKPDDSDDFLNKEQYLKKLTEQRLKEELEEEENKKLEELYTKMKKREYEVSLSRVDFAKIQTENINLIPKDNFHSVDEMFYFLQSLSSKISEKNLQKCLQGLLSLADKIGSKDLENIYYKQFLIILRDNVSLISEPANLLLIAQFLDIFCVSEQKIWEVFERKVLNKHLSISDKDLVQIFLHFSNQKEGSEYFYDRYEEFFKARLAKMSFNDLYLIFQGYFNSKLGTKEFIVALIEEIKNKINDAPPQNLIKLAYYYNQAQNVSMNFVSLLEEKIIEKIDQLSFEDFANCGVAFGIRDSHHKLFKLIEENIMKNIKDLTPLKIKKILEALAFNYRGSVELLLFLKPHVLDNINYFEYVDLANINKSYFIMEVLDPQDEFYKIIEKKIVRHLKDLNNVKNEELIEFVKCFCVSRNASREFYKLMELVVEYKIKDLIRTPDYISTIYEFYSSSGFCSPELLQKLQSFL